METSKTSNETIFEGAKVAEKWFVKTNAAMMEMYNKQLNLTTGFYNNFLNSMSGNNSRFWNLNPAVTNNLFGTDFTKLFWPPLSNGSQTATSNSFLSALEKMYKQLAEFNGYLFNEFNSKLTNGGFDLSAISKEYSDTLKKRMEAYRNIFNSITEAYGKQLDTTIEADKKMIENMNDQFSNVFKQNQKFWTDLFKTVQIPSVTDDKKGKESVQNEGKKRSNMPVLA